jgi:hypothetical protein
MAVHLSQLSTHPERINFALFMFLARLVLPYFTRLSKKTARFSEENIFYMQHVLIFSTTFVWCFYNQDSSVKYELGRSYGNVSFFLFYPNVNTLDACLQYRLSRKSDHWDRHMTRQIVSFRNFANAPERRKTMSEVATSVITAMRPMYYK